MQLVPTTLVKITRYYLLAAAGYLLLTVAIGVLRVVFGLPDERIHWVPAILGWVSFPLMGAYYQFFPTLQGRDLRHERFAVPQFVLVNIGVLGMVAGALVRYQTVFSSALAVYGIGALLFVAVILGNVVAAKINLTLRFYLASLCYFAATVVLMLLSQLVGWPKWVTPALLLHAFAFGWAVIAIMGAEYSMVPMLQLKELRHPRVADFQFYLANIGAIGLAAGIASQQTWLIALFGFVAFVAVLVFAYVIVASLRSGPSRLPKLDLSVRFFLTGVGYLVVTAALGIYIGVTGSLWLTPIHLHLGLIGVVTNTIVGAMYHIVPFVVWWEVYSPRMGSEPVPLLKQLFDERRAMRQYYGLNAGLLLMVVGFATGNTVLLAAGGGLIGIAAIDFLAQMLHVVGHRGLLNESMAHHSQKIV